MGDWYFGYDAIDRLVSATPDTTAPAEYQGGKYACWSYDAFGNCLQETFSTVACGGSNPTPQITAVYNAANNQIQSVTGTTAASFVYDASGNTLYDGVNHYWYDAEGQLCAVQRSIGGAITEYVYDAEGARILKGTLSVAPSTYTSTCAPPPAELTVTNRYLVDLGGQQVTELTGRLASPVWAHSNVWSGGRLSATYDLKGLHLELADPLGTKRVQVNAAGQIDETCTSLPFGNDVGNPLGANCSTVANALGTGDDATELLTHCDCGDSVRRAITPLRAAAKF
jgi:YD repeat-containing protein